ncbi:MAG: hypothetical protein RLY78_3863 [Pseudomonadota bacterium]|jgi:lysophospholipase L1-like esterase
MPIIDKKAPAPVNTDQMAHWKPLHRIENMGASVQITANELHGLPYSRLLYAEGDSWFDKFTPLPKSGTNLIEALRLPEFSVVVDASHIGETADKLVKGWQRRQTQAQFDLFGFDAILLSIGGNDLIDLFEEIYLKQAEAQAGQMLRPDDLQKVHALIRGEVITPFFDQVIANIKHFVGQRDRAKNAKTSKAPLILHGYDWMQPRPAKSIILAGTPFGSGPWLYETMSHAGLNDTQMTQAAQEVVDEFNRRLIQMVDELGPEANIWLLDQRGTLERAAPGSTGHSGDWADEIHLTQDGYRKLANRFWNPWLAKAVNLI